MRDERDIEESEGEYIGLGLELNSPSIKRW